jgi:hypothetical protein
MTVTSVRSTYNRRFSPDSVPGLVIDLDARDLAVGGATSWIDRKNGYIFSGTPVTRNNNINGYPSVSFIGSAPSILTTTTSITQINGVSACTMIILAKGGAVNYPPYTYIIAEIGDGVQVGGMTLLTAQLLGPHYQLNAGIGNAGTPYSTVSETDVGINIDPAAVLTTVVDFSATGAAETNTFRKNGATPPSLATPVIVENTNNFSSHTMSLGARVVTHDYPWTGNIGKVLLYNRHLTNEEMLYLEMGVAKLGGIVI